MVYLKKKGEEGEKKMKFDPLKKITTPGGAGMVKKVRINTVMQLLKMLDVQIIIRQE